MVEKTIELTGTSTNSIEDAVGLAIARAAATIKGIKPEVEVDRITAVVEDGGSYGLACPREGELRGPGADPRVA